MKFHARFPLGRLISRLSRQEQTAKQEKQETLEDPVFQDVDILYNFVFDLGSYVNPTEAARKILKQDFALAAANTLTGETEMALHFKPAFRARQQAQHFSELSLLLHKHQWRATLHWLLRHPRWLPRMRLYFFSRGGKAHQTPPDLSHFSETSKGAIQHLDQIFAHFQTTAELHRYSEALLFAPSYLRQVPFVRVQLQPLHAVINKKKTAIDVWLLIHRTGVAILTFCVRFDRAFTTDALIEAQAAQSILITESEVVKTLLEVQAKAYHFPGAVLQKGHINCSTKGGIAWAKGKTGAGTTLRDAFQLYQDAIIATTLGKKPRAIHSLLRSSDWFQYPVTFIRRIAPEYSNEHDFKEKHAQTLAGLTLGTEGWRDLSAEKVQQAIATDFSLTGASSFYANEGFATVLYYGSFRERYAQTYGKEQIPESQWLYEYFQRTILIEAFLLQQWILHILDDQTNVLPYSIEKLNAIQRHLIVALYEYHNDIFQYGTAQDTLKQAYSFMGIDATYEHLLFKLESIQKLIEAAKSRKQERRNTFLSIVVMLLTLVAGLPSANQIVTILASWKLLPVAQSSATLFLYLALIVSVMCAILWSYWPFGGKGKIVSLDQSGPARRSAFIWPNKITITTLPKRKQQRKQQ